MADLLQGLTTRNVGVFVIFQVNILEGTDLGRNFRNTKDRVHTHLGSLGKLQWVLESP